MKKLFSHATLMAALAFISIAVSGCGKSNSGDPQSGGNSPGGYSSGGALLPGGTTLLPGGGLQISFTGTGVYYTGTRITGATANWGTPPKSYTPPSYYTGVAVSGTVTTGSASLSGSVAKTLAGSSTIYPGSTVTMMATTQYTNGSSPYPLANVAGQITLSPEFVQQAFNGATPNIQGLIIDFYEKGSSNLGGTAFLCDGRDQFGSCQGAFINF